MELLYLKSLELHGFKSFPEKTVIEFDSGSTVIVGPNGSGKSNITDAMRWVLGELSTKNIRGTKMEDVIFVGADGYRQMNFAEVSVTFDDSEPPKKLNSEYDEITVTRRYYRSGDSEYFINRKNVRLKDIYELFMNTGIGRDGYSIIGQGRIAEIISKKSDERRSIFEESAGISKYRYRKHESERKLQETDANMLRVADILSELEGRIGPLERSAQKARKYIELFEKKKTADISLWLYDMVKRNEEIAKLEADLEISRHELDMAEDTFAQLSGQSDRLFEDSQKNKQDQSRIYEEIRAVREQIHALEKDYQLLENNIIHEKDIIVSEKALAERDLENAGKEEVRLSDTEANLRQAEDQCAEAEKELDGAKTKRAELAQQNSDTRREIGELFEQIGELEKKRSELTVRLGVIQNIISQHTERSKAIDSDIASFQVELDGKNAKLDKLRRSVADYDENIKRIDDELLSLDRKINNKSDEISIAKREGERLGAEKSAVDSRISALTRMFEHFDGYNNSVKFVMNEAKSKNLNGIHSPVSYLIRVPDEYTVAVETTLGGALQGIVVDDDSDAKDAIRALKHSGSGRATFYPISSVKGRALSRELEAAKGERGFVGIASELVSCDGIYKGIVSFLLGNVAVFDNIDSASEAAKKSRYSIRIVTLDGQQINPGGSYTGGSARRDSGMITRKNTIDKLKAESDAFALKLANNSECLDGLSREYNDLKSSRADAEERVKIFEALRKTELVDIEETSARCDVLSGFIDQLRSDMSKLDEQEQSGAEDIERLNSECGRISSEIESLSSLRAQKDSFSHDIEGEIESTDTLINALTVRIAELRKDVEGYSGAIAEIKARITDFNESARLHSEKVETIVRSISQAQSVIEDKKAETEDKRTLLASKESEFGELEKDALDFEEKLGELNRKSREISSRKEIVLEAHTKGENKLQNLQNEVEKTAVRIYDEYELTHADAVKLEYPQVTKENRSAVAQTLNETKNAIRALGSVNVEAIDEYAELKERYDGIKKQFDDLSASKEELNALIESISGEMEVIFKDAFEKINKNFGDVFKELFGGGHAELSLTDPEDVLNCGIEISAAPPGKLVKSLSLLSGGEQSFVAIALMFAMIKVNPAPFCIFDEIEAALDEVNVSRFASFVSTFSKDIQIILITHRRGTMEIADTLYGVTMPSHGVSKVFTLDVSSVSRQKFAEENL